MLNSPDKFQIVITADLTEQGLGILRGSDDVEIQQVNPSNVPALRDKLLRTRGVAHFHFMTGK